jgi:hypothetical protein
LEYQRNNYGQSKGLEDFKQHILLVVSRSLVKGCVRLQEKFIGCGDLQIYIGATVQDPFQGIKGHRKNVQDITLSLD